MKSVAACAQVVNVDTILAVIAAAGTIVTALALLAVQVLKNARDVGAAWRQLRIHEKALNGAVEAPRKAQEP